MSEIRLTDFKPETGDFLQEAIEGLSSTPRRLPCKYFYDERGARLFEAICELPEYYPTRTEIGILESHLDAMGELIGPDARIVEYGSGAGQKIRLLLEALDQPVAYTPIDIAREQLLSSSAKLQETFPAIEILPVCADYSSPLSLPRPARPFSKTVVFFPGSTIGNFEPEDARNFLQRFAQLAEQGKEPGGLLIGVDLKKNVAKLEAAYNDQQGVTADFNTNLLERMNRELGANFKLGGWQHRAHWNADTGAIEMHLICQQAQQVQLNGAAFHFAQGESIHTENSFKYHPEEFQELANQAGFVRRGLWTDAEELFSVQYFSLSS